MQSNKPTVPSAFNRQEYMDYLRVKYNVPSNIRKMHKGNEVIRWVYENNPDVEIELTFSQDDAFSLTYAPDFKSPGFYRIKPTPVVKRQVIFRHCGDDYHRISYNRFASEKEFADAFGHLNKFIAWYEPTAEYREE